VVNGKTPKTPADLLAGIVRIASERIRPKLGPEDDWMPVLFLWNGRLSIIGLQYDSDEAKAVAYQQFAPSAIRQSKAWMAATINTARLRKGKVGMTDAEIRELPPVEVVIARASDWAGNEAVWVARIVRSETEPPQLVVDEEMSTAGWLGGVVEPIDEALKANREHVQL
jgi:hypothetical protein